MKKSILSSLAILLLIGPFITVWAEAEEKPQYGGVLKQIMAPRAPSRFGVPRFNRMIDYGSSLEFYEGLLKGGPPPETIRPALAESWELAPDKKSYTFHLRKGVKFHDGTDFNARAVKYNFDIILEKDKSVFKNVTSVEVINDYTVRINQSVFDPGLLIDLTWGSGHIASPKAMKEMGEKGMMTHPVGTGPFKFKSYKQDVRLVSERFEDYWRKGLPYLDGVQWDFVREPTVAQLALEKGDVHIIFRASPKIGQDLKKKGFKVVTAPSVVRTLVPDTMHPDSVFNNKKVREAISYALNRPAYAKALGFGFFKPAYQVAGKSVYGYNPGIKPREYNPKKAKQLLKEAGYPNGFKMTIVGSSKPSHEANLWTAVKADLAKVGIEVELDLVEPRRMRVLVYKGGVKTNTLISKHIGQEIEYIHRMKTEYHTASPFIPEFRKTDDLDDLIMAGLMAETSEKRAKATKAVVRKIYDDVMVIPIWVEFTTWPMDPAVMNPPYGTIDHSHAWLTETWLKQK